MCKNPIDQQQRQLGDSCCAAPAVHRPTPELQRGEDRGGAGASADGGRNQSGIASGSVGGVVPTIEDGDDETQACFDVVKQSYIIYDNVESYIYDNMEELWGSKQSLSPKRSLPSGAVATLPVDTTVWLELPLQHNSKGSLMAKISERSHHTGKWVVVRKANGVELMMMRSVT